jgi:hypothetical protein
MNTWTVEDFITYLYHIVADADLETGVKEIAVVKKRASSIISKYLDNPTYSYEASLKKIQDTEGVSLIQAEEVIKKLILKFQLSKEVKNAVFEDINAIAIADERLTAAERETIGFIKRTLLATEMPLSW